MWKFAFTPSVVPPFPKYRFHWVAKIIIFLDVVSVLISGLFILTILNVIPDYYGFMMVETSTSTPTITPTLISNTPQHPRPISTIDPCGRFVSRIYKGEKVRSANILDENLNIRRSPSLSAEIITYVKNGTEFQILDGPVCADNLMWWEASTKNGSIKGWVAEVNSFGIYYLEP